MKKRSDFSRLKKYSFYKILQLTIKALTKRFLKIFILATIFLSIAALCICSIVSAGYRWIVWVGAAVLLVLFQLFANLWLPAYDIIKYRYVPHKKVLLRLNDLKDDELADIENSLQNYHTVGYCLYTKEFFVGPRIFVYYKDVVSIEHRSRTVIRFKKAKGGNKKFYEHYLIVTDKNNEKWYASAVYNSDVYELNQVYEELLIRCDSNIKIIGDFAYKGSLTEESAHIRTTAEKIINVIHNRDKDELHSMFCRHIKENDFSSGIEYIFDIFKGQVVSINDYRSYTKPCSLDNEYSKIGLGRYTVVTEENEYYLFFAYSIRGGLDQGKLYILKLVPKGSMTEKEFFIDTTGLIYTNVGIYHLGWDAEMS